MLPPLLAHLRLPASAPAGAVPARTRCWPTRRTRPRAHRDHLRERGVTVVIPERADQITNRRNPGTDGGWPVNFDAQAYCGRNVVERAFNKVKNWRALATRYDKHAVIYRGGIVLAAILLWLDH
jgi:transposase